ncbi:MAG: hypothetical protein ABI670_01100 [Chloroflexota bacterium]
MNANCNPLSALSEQIALANYLYSPLGSNHFDMVAAVVSAQMPMSAHELRSLHMEVAVIGAALHIPAQICTALEQSVRCPDRATVNWRLTSSALPTAQGFCWFETPITLVRNNGRDIEEIAALTWTYGHLVAGGPGSAHTPGGIVLLSAFVKTPNRAAGEPASFVQWALNRSLLENMRLLGMYGKSTLLDSNSMGLAILRLFSTLFSCVESGTWSLRDVPASVRLSVEPTNHVPHDVQEPQSVLLVRKVLEVQAVPEAS